MDQIPQDTTQEAQPTVSQAAGTTPDQTVSPMPQQTQVLSEPQTPVSEQQTVSNPVLQSDNLQEVSQRSQTSKPQSEKKGSMAKTLFELVIFLVVIVGLTYGVYLYFNSSKVTVIPRNNAVFTQPATVVTPAASSSGYVVNPSDTSNQSINNDTSNINQSMNNINSDMNTVDQSFNDQQTNLQ
ncbi:hypothetical protein M1615_03010 [Patescibacteria group bacterium]|nr:hypothetical protein [Patescibacteria group bacterium]